MKICICISGQIRGLSALSHLSKQVHELSKLNDVQVIISTWRKSGNKIDGALTFDQIHRIFDDLSTKLIPPTYYGNQLWRRLPKTYNKIIKDNVIDVEEVIKEYFPGALIDIEEEILDLEFPKKIHDKNSKKMLYKRWRCNEIKKRIERLNQSFDSVLVTRPDFYIEFDKISDNIILNNRIIYSPSQLDQENNSSDFFAYGNSFVIDKYCELFSEAITDEWEYIHSSLSRHLKHHSIEERRSEIIKHKGLEKNKLLSLSDIVDDDPLFISLDKIRAIDSNDAITELNIRLKGPISDEMKISYNLLMSFKYKEKGQYEDALLAFISSDISVIEILHLRGRNKYLLNQFIEYCQKLFIFSIDALIFNKVSQIQYKNIKFLMESDIFKKEMATYVLKESLIKKDFSKIDLLISANLFSHTDPAYISTLKLKAMEAEKIDSNLHDKLSSYIKIYMNSHVNP